MINLRYHIVSITAVFLALGIGIAMGSSFLSDAAVDQVGRNIESTRNEARAARTEAAELREEADRRAELDEQLHGQAAARLFRDGLDGVPVVLLTVGGIDQGSVDLLRTALESSGADFTGTLTVTDRVEAEGDDADTLSALLDREGGTTGELRAALVSGVADELLAASEPAQEEEEEEPTPETPESTEPAVPEDTQPGEQPPEETTTTTEAPVEEEPEGPELVRALVAEGILDFDPAQSDLPADEILEQSGHRYVIVSGADADVRDGTFFRPLLRAMTENGPAPVVVASAAVGDDAEADREAVIAPLLAEDVVAARISTVDDLESVSGLMAVMLSLDDLGRERRGHYGIGPSAESQLPAP